MGKLDEILETLHATHGTGGRYLSPEQAKSFILNLFIECVPSEQPESPLVIGFNHGINACRLRMLENIERLTKENT